MNKTKKGLLTAGAILTIVSSALCVFCAMLMFIIGGVFNEKMLKESYLEDTAYTYTENVDGSYYFTTIEDGAEIVITEDEIELIAKVASAIFVVLGVLVLGWSAAKIALAIRVLVMNNRGKYAKGSTIALLVLSILNNNLIEAVLFIVAMCQKDQPIENKPQQEVIT
ncbi:MAG: hypothetical protein IKY10_05210, partial [Clostridia bacterium]|nr:hypothetical protein [Clostridia bacterium]